MVAATIGIASEYTPAMNVAPLHDNARTLVLTGASRGIGHATVKKFSAGGWRVITVSRQPFSALCPWPGGDKSHVQIDLADPADVGRGIEDIRVRLGGGKLPAPAPPMRPRRPLWPP